MRETLADAAMLTLVQLIPLRNATGEQGFNRRFSRIADYAESPYNKCTSRYREHCPSSDVVGLHIR
jgi:hypothetical protein